MDREQCVECHRAKQIPSETLLDEWVWHVKNTAIHTENCTLDMKSCSACSLRTVANNVLIPSTAGKAV